MYKRGFAFLLIFLLLFGLNACSATIVKKAPSEENGLAKREGALNILAQVIDDYTVAYDSPHGNVSTTLYSGDRVRIYTVEDEWAETSHGWILLEMLYYDSSSLPSVETAPVNTALSLLSSPLRGEITGDSLRIRKTAGDGEIIGQLNTGDQIVITYFTHVDETIWCYMGTGWISMDYVRLPDFNLHGAFAAYFKTGTYLREEPGVIRSNDKYLGSDGLMNIWQLHTLDNMVWGLTKNGWVNMNECTMPGNVRIMTGTYTEDITQTPNYTNLVGRWVQFPSGSFMSNGHNRPMFWTFRSDGSFYVGSEAITYSYEDGGFGEFNSDTGYEGIFFYEGSNLQMYQQIYYDPGPVPQEDYAEYYCTVSGNTAKVGSYTLYRCDDYTQYVYNMTTQNAGTGVSQVTGIWNESHNRSLLTLKSDGTFAESTPNGEGSGYYMCINGHIYMAYTKRHGRSSSFLYYASYVVYADSLIFSHTNWSLGTQQLNYERIENEDLFTP